MSQFGIWNLQLCLKGALRFIISWEINSYSAPKCTFSFPQVQLWYMHLCMYLYAFLFNAVLPSPFHCQRLCLCCYINKMNESKHIIKNENSINQTFYKDYKNNSSLWKQIFLFYIICGIFEGQIERTLPSMKMESALRREGTMVVVSKQSSGLVTEQ